MVEYVSDCEYVRGLFQIAEDTEKEPDFSHSGRYFSYCSPVVGFHFFGVLSSF